MYIQPNYNDYNINMYGAGSKPGFWKRLKQKAMNALPEATFKDNNKNMERWDKYDKAVSHPAKNRLIMGITALATQPTIDYFNHKVDKETREISTIRTVSKIVAGTLVGIAVRSSCYGLVKKMTNIKGKGKFSKALLPTKHLNDLIKNKTLLDNYRSALSTTLAILAMCFTNFAIDAPLTIFLTNYANQKRVDNKAMKGGKVDE